MPPSIDCVCCDFAWEGPVLLQAAPHITPSNTACLRCKGGRLQRRGLSAPHDGPPCHLNAGMGVFSGSSESSGGDSSTDSSGGGESGSGGGLRAKRQSAAAAALASAADAEEAGGGIRQRRQLARWRRRALCCLRPAAGDGKDVPPPGAGSAAQPSWLRLQLLKLRLMKVRGLGRCQLWVSEMVAHAFAGHRSSLTRTVERPALPVPARCSRARMLLYSVRAQLGPALPAAGRDAGQPGLCDASITWGGAGGVAERLACGGRPCTRHAARGTLSLPAHGVSGPCDWVAVPCGPAISAGTWPFGSTAASSGPRSSASSSVRLPTQCPLSSPAACPSQSDQSHGCPPTARMPPALGLNPRSSVIPRPECGCHAPTAHTCCLGCWLLPNAAVILIFAIQSTYQPAPVVA